MDVLELVCDFVVVGFSWTVAAFYLNVGDLLLFIGFIELFVIFVSLFDDLGLCLRFDHYSLADSYFELILVFIEDDLVLFA